jgi:hypothetical protein
VTPIERYNAAFEKRPAADEKFKKSLIELHPNTAVLVIEFATALAEKLRVSEIKHGFSDNWAREDWQDECIRDLCEHLRKGDPRDVAAYCAFAWHHGWSTVPPVLQTIADDLGDIP